jgi:hypothetical protein
MKDSRFTSGSHCFHPLCACKNCPVEYASGQLRCSKCGAILVSRRDTARHHLNRLNELTLAACESESLRQREGDGQ